MPTFEEIYARHAPKYDDLVSREDYQGNILPAIQRVIALDGIHVVEFGAGTGRLTRLLVPYVKVIHAFDRSPHMLTVAMQRLQQAHKINWTLRVAENKAIPLPSQSADLTIAGWSFGHVTEWHPTHWRDEINAAVSEMKRLLRPGGAAIIMETLGTASETPAPPNQNLAAYYALLENEHGFKREAIRTDYRFESLDEADKLVRFFFGEEMADHVCANNWVIVPEWTGVWSLRVD